MRTDTTNAQGALARRQLRSMVFWAAASAALAGCGGGGSGGSPAPAPTPTPSPPAVTAQDRTLDLGVIGVAPSSVASTVVAQDSAGRPLTYTITQAPSTGTATINAQTGAFTYTVPGQVLGNVDQFTVSVSNGSQSATSTVRINLGRDPLLEAQWYIRNNGASAFASDLPVAGNDMNVAPAWAAGYSGRGIKVAVVDEGLEAAHEDLSANVDVAKSFNFITGLNDPSRLAADPGDDHGTMVAGIIGAIGFNGKGGRGIAFRATLRGYNYMKVPTLTNYAKSMGSDPISADNDIFSGSFSKYGVAGMSSLPTFSGSYQSVAANLQNLRGGKGAVWVSSAGNDFGEFRNAPAAYCAAANQYGVSCSTVAVDERRGGRTPIIVGALNASGIKSSYSTTGSGLWISAAGGESGLSATYFPGLPDPAAYKPAIVTTARTGCTNSPYPNPVNSLDAKGANPLAPNCQYTAVMNGTSSATPAVSGVVALMLEANPQLTWRDVRHILAQTAKKIDPAFPGRTATDVIPNQTVVLEQGWVTNKAGWSFSNWYGFGAIDAGAAVAVAKSYTAYLPPIREANPYLVIPPAPYVVPALTMQGYPITYQVAEPFNTVEFVTVFVNIDQTPIAGCNQIELTSPSGTKSILLHGANGFQNIAMPNVRFLSNAFYGEPINGTWTLRFLDLCGFATSTVLSATQPQVLLLSGH